MLSCTQLRALKVFSLNDCMYKLAFLEDYVKNGEKDILSGIVGPTLILKANKITISFYLFFFWVTITFSTYDALRCIALVGYLGWCDNDFVEAIQRPMLSNVYKNVLTYRHKNRLAVEIVYG